MADLDRAIELSPHNTEAFADRGFCRNKLGRYEEALSDLRRAIALDPEGASAYINIAVSLRGLDRLEEALPYLERASRLTDPSRSAQAREMLRQAETILGRGRLYSAAALPEPPAMADTRAELESSWLNVEPGVLQAPQPFCCEQAEALLSGLGSSMALVEMFVDAEEIVVFTLRAWERQPIVERIPMSSSQLRSILETYYREIVEYAHHGDIGQSWQDAVRGRGRRGGTSC